MKYFLIAGERSGDLYGSLLIRSLKRLDPKAKIHGIGGDLMHNEGMKILHHYKDLAFMGFWEVIKNIAVVRRLIKRCKKAIIEFSPDVVVLIDFPGFNLRIADYASKNGIKTSYYISPKVWAWGSGRIRKIKNNVDQMLVIFPFEVEFYKQYDIEARYVGNPLVEHISSYTPGTLNLQGDYEYVISFFAGSRKQEVERSVDILRQVSNSRSDCLFLVPSVDNLDETEYDELRHIPNVRVLRNSNYEALSISDAAIITSGTATLECALWKVPQVVGYRTSWISYQIAMRLVKIKFISLVNILRNKSVIKELIQSRFNANVVLDELQMLLKNSDYRNSIIEEYAEIRKELGDNNASDTAAKEIVELCSN